jgi:hypothetical protein
MPFIFTSQESPLAVADNHPDSTTATIIAEEVNANPQQRKSNNQHSSIERKEPTRKSQRTPKKRARYAPHQSGIEVQVNAAMALMAKTTVEDEDRVDFEDVTHRVTSGEFESYEGFITSEDDSRVILCLIKNQSGNKMKSALTRTFEKTEVRELDSYDMLEFSAKTDGETDEALVEYEQECWECRKCQNFNSNDAGYCSNMVGRKQCGGTKLCEMLSWGDCFSQVCEDCFSFFVNSSIVRKD